ncbi:MAG: hypothetical protein Kow0090_15710 [Myxococcota bacterium]
MEKGSFETSAIPSSVSLARRKKESFPYGESSDDRAPKESPTTELFITKSLRVYQFKD